MTFRKRDFYIATMQGDLDELKRLIQQHQDRTYCSAAREAEQESTTTTTTTTTTTMELIRTARFHNEETLLHAAAKSGRIALVRYLVEKCQVNVEMTDNYGDTPLLTAACFRYMDIVRALIQDYHCNVRVRDRNGETVLHKVCSNPTADLDMVRLILDRGGGGGGDDWNEMLAMRDQRGGHTVLHKACDVLHLTLIRFLVLECHMPVEFAVDDDDEAENKYQSSSTDSPLQLAMTAERHLLGMIENMGELFSPERQRLIHDNANDVIRFLIECNPRISSPSDLATFWCRRRGCSTLSSSSSSLVLRWQSRMHWIACYSETVLGITRETTEKYPLHSILQCDPLFRLRSDTLKEISLEVVEDPPETLLPAAAKPFWRSIFEHFGSQVCLSRREGDGKEPLQLYFQQYITTPTLSSPPPPKLDMLQALFQVEPRVVHSLLVEFNNNNKKCTDGPIDFYAKKMKCTNNIKRADLSISEQKDEAQSTGFQNHPAIAISLACLSYQQQEDELQSIPRIATKTVMTPSIVIGDDLDKISKDRQRPLTMDGAIDHDDDDDDDHGQDLLSVMYSLIRPDPMCFIESVYSI